MLVDDSVDNITIIDSSTDEVIAIIYGDEIITLNGYESIINVGVEE